MNLTHVRKIDDENLAAVQRLYSDRHREHPSAHSAKSVEILDAEMARRGIKPVTEICGRVAPDVADAVCTMPAVRHSSHLTDSKMRWDNMEVLTDFPDGVPCSHRNGNPITGERCTLPGNVEHARHVDASGAEFFASKTPFPNRPASTVTMTKIVNPGHVIVLKSGRYVILSVNPRTYTVAGEDGREGKITRDDAHIPIEAEPDFDWWDRHEAAKRAALAAKPRLRLGQPVRFVADAPKGLGGQSATITKVNAKTYRVVVGIGGDEYNVSHNLVEAA